MNWKQASTLGLAGGVAFFVYVFWVSSMMWAPAEAAEAQEILPTDRTIVGVGRSYETVASGSTLSIEFDPGSAATVDTWELLWVGVHLDAAEAAANSFLIQCDSGLGSGYDQVLNPDDYSFTAGETDYIFIPTGAAMLFADGDKIDIVAGTTPTANVGVQMMWRGGK